MTRFAKILSLVLALSLLLCGCATTPEAPTEETIPAGDQLVSCDGLTFRIPKTFEDMSDEAFAADYSFMYACYDTQEAVLGFNESRGAVASAYQNSDMSAETYAKLLVAINQYDCEVGKLGDLVTFTYTATTDDITLTYLCGVFASANYYWCVQFYCPAENFEANQDKFMGYLQSVQVQGALTN